MLPWCPWLGQQMQFNQLKRREFITLLGGAAAGWPLAARAQPRERVRRVGALTTLTADDPESQGRLAAFAQGLQQAGWTVGQNVRIDHRWATNADDLRRSAAELVALAPDVILVQSSNALAALLQATRTIPIVFTLVAGPVGAAYIADLASPGRHAT